MIAVQAVEPNAPLQVAERPLPQPGPRQVRIKVEACGVCHSDSLTVGGYWPGLKFPRVPGHEVVGVIDAVGEDCDPWRAGQRVGVGWYGGSCGKCERCRSGDGVTCQFLQIPGISYDGGYAEYMVAPMVALAAMPEGLTAVEAAPLLCAGITTYNSLRRSGALAGDVVAVLGIGGLGHLGVQFAAKMGFETVAIARGADKGPLAKKLGAHHYIDSQSQDVAAELQRLGGARVVLSTVTNGPAVTACIGGLAVNGSLTIVGVPDAPLQVDVQPLIMGRRQILGWPSGTAVDSEATLKFSALTGIRSSNEVYPLQEAAAAFARMMSGQARFRVVLQAV